MTVLKVLLAVLVPPLAVFLQRGVGFSLLLSIGLTVLGVPMGIFHAFWVLSRSSGEESVESEESDEGERTRRGGHPRMNAATPRQERPRAAGAVRRARRWLRRHRQRSEGAR